MASASGSSLRADAKPYKPVYVPEGRSVGPVRAPPCTFPVSDGTSMPAPVPPLWTLPGCDGTMPMPPPPWTFPGFDGTMPMPPPPPPNTEPWPDVEEARDFIRKTICTALSKVSKEADASFVVSVNAPDPCKIATEVEAVLFKHWGFNDPWKPVAQKYRVLVGTMVRPGIKDLRRELLLGEIMPEELANMSTLELHQKYPRRMLI